MAKKPTSSGSKPRQKHVRRSTPQRAATVNKQTNSELPHKLLSCLKNKKVLFNEAVFLMDTDRNIKEIESSTGLKPGFNWTVFDRDYPHIGDIEKTKRYKLIHYLLIRLLKRGTLTSFGYHNGRFEQVFISKEDWRNDLSLSYFNTATRYSDNEGVEDVSLINVHVTYESNDKHPGGAPVKYDWNKLLQEWLCEVIEKQNGFPQSQKAAYDIFIKIYQREEPDDEDGGPSDRMFAIKMEEAFPLIWSCIAPDKKPLI